MVVQLEWFWSLLRRREQVQPNHGISVRCWWLSRNMFIFLTGKTNHKYKAFAWINIFIAWTKGWSQLNASEHPNLSKSCKGLRRGNGAVRRQLRSSKLLNPPFSTLLSVHFRPPPKRQNRWLGLSEKSDSQTTTVFLILAKSWRQLDVFGSRSSLNQKAFFHIYIYIYILEKYLPFFSSTPACGLEVLMFQTVAQIAGKWRSWNTLDIPAHCANTCLPPTFPYYLRWSPANSQILGVHTPPWKSACNLILQMMWWAALELVWPANYHKDPLGYTANTVKGLPIELCFPTVLTNWISVSPCVIVFFFLSPYLPYLPLNLHQFGGGSNG